MAETSIWFSEVVYGEKKYHFYISNNFKHNSKKFLQGNLSDTMKKTSVQKPYKIYYFIRFSKELILKRKIQN